MNIEKILAAVDLYEHNLVAYEKIKERIKNNKKTCVVHATGTGKSFLAIKLMLETLLSGENKKVTYIYPLGGIKEQVEEHIESLKEYMVDKITEEEYNYVSKLFSSIHYMSYQSLITKKGIEDSKTLKSDLFVVDEFHHIGAPEWTNALNNLFNNNENAKIFGMSATPVRNSGKSNEENVAQTFFEGNIASTFDLSDAIAAGVLPAPNYHCASFYLENEAEDLEKILRGDSIVDSAEREEYKNALIKIKSEIAKLDKETDIFKEHLKKDGKYIYFCPKGSNISELQDNFLENLPEEYRENVEFYSVHSSENTSPQNKLSANNFYNNISSNDNVSNNSNKLRVMFAIDMYNEGIHVPDIDGVIMGRASKSDIVFYQQLGRALSVKKNGKSPLVIDLMGNIHALQVLKQKAKEKRDAYDKEKLGDSALIDYEEKDFDFGLSFDIINILEELNKLKNKNDYYESYEYRLKNIADKIKQDEGKDSEGKLFKVGTSDYGWVKYNRNKIIDSAEEKNEAAMYIVSNSSLFKKQDEKDLERMKTIADKIKQDEGKNPEDKLFKCDTADYSWVLQNKKKIGNCANAGNKDAIYIIANSSLFKKQDDKDLERMKTIADKIKQDDGKNPAEKTFKRGTTDYSWVKATRNRIRDYAAKGDIAATYIVDNCSLLKSPEELLEILLSEILADFKTKNSSDKLTLTYKKKIISLGISALNKEFSELTAIEKICISLLSFDEFKNSLAFKRSLQKLNSEIGLEDLAKKIKEIEDNNERNM